MSTQPKTIAAQAIGLVVWLGICFVAAAVGGWASVNAPAFYAELERPTWSPPGYVFGPVWTVLYALMGISAWLIWREVGFRGARSPLVLFLAQLVLNALWSWLFFGWRLGLLSFVDILILWVAIVATLVAFWRLNRLAGGLLIPYLLWVTFAAVLNFSIWQLNRPILG